MANDSLGEALGSFGWRISRLGSQFFLQLALTLDSWPNDFELPDAFFVMNNFDGLRLASLRTLYPTEFCLAASAAQDLDPQRDLVRVRIFPDGDSPRVSGLAASPLCHSLRELGVAVTLGDWRHGIDWPSFASVPSIEVPLNDFVFACCAWGVVQRVLSSTIEHSSSLSPCITVLALLRFSYGVFGCN